MIFGQPSSGSSNKRTNTTDHYHGTRNAGAIDSPVKPIKIAPYQSRALKNLDHSPNQSEEEYQRRFAFRPTETPKKCQHGESGGVIQPIVVEAYIESEFLKTRRGQKRKHKNGKQRDEKSYPFGD
ncbi:MULTISPECIES: hypothetical protein [unclassified Mesorhizobium]|uniref:hypothetical protein n=1 Tax=unclassified Mesorhizobium TaxID=325217 RepID=UPI0016759828|nr:MULTISPECIES: hypothetical protein [unclassified Mesorhizobium]